MMMMMIMKVLKVLTKAGSDDINASGCQSAARQNFPTKANNSIEVNFLLFIIIRKCANAANNSICQFLLQTSHCLLFRQHSREKDCHLSKKTFFVFQLSHQLLPVYNENKIVLRLYCRGSWIHNLVLSYFRNTNFKFTFNWKLCFWKVWQLLLSPLSLSWKILMLQRYMLLLILSLSLPFWCKHRKNCECCPGHYLIVNHYSSI